MYSQQCAIAQPGPLVVQQGVPTSYSTFYSYSSLGSIDTAAWRINGVLVSTQLNPALTFPTLGFHNLQVMHGNKGFSPGTLACSDVMTFPIKVVCPIQANYTMNPSVVVPGSTVTFVQASTGSTSYTWLLDGRPTASGPTWTYTFQGSGTREVCLVVSSANGCKDTLCTAIPVGDCGHSRNKVWTMFGGFGDGIFFYPNGNWGGIQNANGYGESCASICDKQGNLAFYTNGTNIYRDNLWPPVAQNGFFGGPIPPNCSGLFGESAGQQRVIIVPRPGIDSLYHLFTTGGGFGAHPGFYHSEFDLRIGTLGGLTRKNQQLMAKASGLATSVHHANGCDFWVLGHSFAQDSTDFCAYQLTASGLDTIPVISKIGAPHNIGSNLNNSDPFGPMKISPTGTKVALVFKQSRIIELFDFNKQTGKLSNPMSIQVPWLGLVNGLEFSPDGSKLYGTVLNVSSGIVRSFLFQINLNAGNPNAIRSSLRMIYYHHPVNMHPPMALLRSPYGKIYVQMATGGLDVIEKPNEVGAECFFVTSGGGTIFGGNEFGPNHVGDFGVNFRQRIRGPKTLCLGAHQQQYYFDLFNCEDSVAWSFSPAVVVNAQAHGAVWLDFPVAGQHHIYAEAFTECGHYFDTLVVNVGGNAPLVSLGADRLFCTGAPVSGTLNAGPGYSSYYWSNGSNGSQLNVTQLGAYSVTVTQNGCTAIDTVLFKIRPPRIPNLGPDQDICQGGNLVLNPGSGFNQFLWSTGATTSTITVNTPGTFWVRTRDSCNNFRYDTLVLAPAYNFQFSLGADTTLCPGHPLPLSIPAGTTGAQWSTGATSSSIVVSQTGTYWLNVVSPSGCYGRDSITVAVDSSFNIDLGPDLVACADSPFVLTPTPNGSVLQWQDGSTAPQFIGQASGVYWVDAIGPNNCHDRDSVTVQVLTPNWPGLGPDISFCAGDSIVLDAGQAWTNYQWQDGSTSSQLTVTQSGNYAVTVLNNFACPYRDTVAIQALPLPVPGLGADTTLCMGASLLLQPGAGFVHYLWQDQSTASSYLINGSGSYQVTVTDSAGCIATDSLLVTFTSHARPDLGLDTLVCTAPSFVLSPGSGYLSYQWQDGSGNDHFDVSMPGLYIVATVDSAGCSSSDSILVILDPIFMSSIGPDTVLCPGDSLLLQVLPSIPSASYIWSDGSIGPTHLVFQTGTYTVSISSSNGCLTTDSIFVLPCGVHASAPSPSQVLEIHPNPASELVTLAFLNGPARVDYMVRLFEAGGRLVFEGNWQAGTSTYQIPLGALAQGVYQVQVRAEEREFSGKVVKR